MYKIYDDVKELVSEFSKDVQVKSDKSSMIKFKVTIDKSDLRERIKDDIEMERVGNLNEKYYKKLLEDIEDFGLDIEIEPVEDFIDNKNFKKHTEYGILKGYSEELFEVYNDIYQDKYITNIVFDDGLFKALNKIGCCEYIDKSIEDEKNFIYDKYTNDKLKNILSKKDIKASGSKAVLIDRIFEHNLLKTPQALKINKDKIIELIDNLVKIYAAELTEQSKLYDKKIKQLLKESAITENYNFKKELKDYL